MKNLILIAILASGIAWAVTKPEAKAQHVKAETNPKAAVVIDALENGTGMYVYAVSSSTDAPVINSGDHLADAIAKCLSHNLILAHQEGLVFTFTSPAR